MDLIKNGRLLCDLRKSKGMTKEHYISFISYVTFDRTLTLKLYPEQDSSARFPRMYGGKLYYYCNKHGLFVSMR